jgi:prepilin-type N-terminal cleavage/methylation domain-containing protein
MNTRHSRSAGFTLVELMVAVVVASILAGVILQVVTGQARSTDIQFARQEVRDNTRGALELVASELRGLSSAAGAIHYAGSDSIRFRTPLVWGVYCAATGGTTMIRVDSVVWSAIRATVPATVGVAVQTVVSPETYAYSDAASSTGIVAVPPGNCAASAMQSDNKTVVVGFTGVSTTTVPATPPPTIGRSVYLYRNIAYGDGVATTTSDRWMTRGLGTSVEPLAGPIDSLTFRYLNSTNTILSAPVADPTQIRSIRVIIAMKARRGTGADSLQIARSRDSVTIALRNVR